MHPKKRHYVSCEICGDRAFRKNDEKRKFMARFPLDEARCKQWVKNVGKEDLIYVPIEKLHELKFICGEHFVKKHFNAKKNRLKKLAVPTVNLKGEPLSDEMMDQFPCHIAENTDIPEETKLCIAGPSTSEWCLSGQQSLSENKMTTLQSRKRPHSPGQIATTNSPAKKAIEKIQEILNETLTSKLGQKSLQEITPQGDIATVESAAAIKAIEKIQEILKDTVSSKPGGETFQEVTPNAKSSQHNTITSIATLNSNLETYGSDSSENICLTQNDSNNLTNVANIVILPEENSILPDQNINAPPISTSQLKDPPHICTLTEEVRSLEDKLKAYQRKEKRQVARIKSLKNFATHPGFLKRLEAMTPSVKILTLLQCREAKKNDKGRRFNGEERQMALTLCEHNKVVYKRLRSLGFILPSVRSTSGYVAKEEPCANPSVEMLRQKVRNLKPAHRFCSVLFDEKVLRKGNRQRKVIAVDAGGCPLEVEADHVLMFMVKGILKFYQETVSVLYSHGPTNGTQLAEHLKQVISDLQSVGFKVVATICDQAKNNRRAIEILINEARCEFLVAGDEYYDNVFVVNNDKIVSMYDPPHLLKGIRNHLISKDLTFELSGKRKTAKWEHLIMMLNECPEYKQNKLLDKLTEKHVYPNAQDITNVKLATQIFSQSVSTYMGYMAEKGILPADSQETADLLLFFDQLFDSFNGLKSNTHVNGKPLLYTCRKESAHHQKWKESIEVLKTMTFLENGRPVETDEIECWIWTIRSVQVITKKLLSEYKLPNVWMRHFNQDALERFFRNEVNGYRGGKRLTEEDMTKKVINAISRTNKEIDEITPILNTYTHIDPH